MAHRAYIARVTDNFEEPLREALSWVGWEEIVASGARVCLKPNFTIPRHQPGVTTSPNLLRALVSILRGRTNHILICESNGGMDSFSAEEAFEGHGVYELASRYGVQPINLSRMPSERVKVEAGIRSTYIELPTMLLNGEVDLLVTVPVLKTHVLTGVTIGFKNLWGCIPNSKRLLYHAVLNEAIATIAAALKPRLAIVDALYAMDGSGPMYGDVVEMNALVAADSVGAADLVGCQLMHIDPVSIPHLRFARKCGLLPLPEEVTVNVNPRTICHHRFAVKRSVFDRGAAMAARSSFATWLIYLSPLSGLKNWVMRQMRGTPMVARDAPEAERMVLHQ